MASIRFLRSHVLAAATALLLASVVAASAQQRCEGTLCDLYYDHMATPARPGAPAQAPQPAQPATTAPAADGTLARLFSGGAPQPAQPDGAPPAKKPLVAVQGGGVVGLMQGRSPQRCTGTLCDLYYGGSPKEEPAAAEPVAAAPAANEADAEPEAPAVTGRGFESRESVRRCAVNARDPWACYR